MENRVELILFYIQKSLQKNNAMNHFLSEYAKDGIHY
jgi:hypothetical protein